MSEQSKVQDREDPKTLDAVPQPMCGLCGCAGELCYPDLQDRHFNAPGTWTHLLCPRCHLIWLSPQPSPAGLACLYSDYYTHSSPEDEPLLVRAVTRGIPAAIQNYGDIVSDPRERNLGRLFSLVGPLAELGRRGTMGLSGASRGTLLDFGCGDGEFLRHMRSLGWRVTGFEHDPRAAQVARETLGDDCVYTELENAKAAAPDGFDAITLSHVIEHLLDPIATLVECAACLRPGGKLVIATPNTASRGHRHFGRNWLHLDPPRHINLFNAGTLTEVTRRAGFRVVSVASPSSSAHFVWQASSKIAERGFLPGIRVEDLTAWGLFESGLFWMWEYILTRFGALCGEELLLTAITPEERSS
ncbi:MAG: class I SAM-dependent methyltransferase [Myxococcales bacterium]|nr:class I SAM-dependent methyltransferase [Myxococcales bacterium]